MNYKILLLITFISTTTFSWEFVEKTNEVGLQFQHGFDENVLIQEPQLIASGLAIGDVNGDGWDDIFVVTGETMNADGLNINPNKLYISQQDGTYIDMADAFNLSSEDVQSSGPLIIDINGDGKRDLIFGSVGLNNGFSLYLNQNNSSFFKRTHAFPNISSFGISAADTDKDGDLDLFMSHWLLDSAHAYWLNDGLGNFTDVTDIKINASTYKNSFTPIFADINNNNWSDLLLTSDFSSSKYFLNDLNGSMLLQDLAEITDENGMGAAVGDYDNDGDLDWFVSSIFDADGFDEGNWGVTGNRLYNNNGEGMFIDVSDSAGVKNGYWGWGACFADFNNDMFLDIFHVNGFPTLTVGEGDFIDDPSRLFINDQNGGFIERSVQLNLTDNEMGRSILCFDNDRDGDIDILINNNQGQSKFYQNNLDNNNNFITIKLLQKNSNIDAIGAKIQVMTGDVTQLRQIVAGGNFASSSPTAQHFGLGNITVIDSILITWPDDTTQVLTDIEANQYLTINKRFSIKGKVKDIISNTSSENIQVQLYSETGELLQSINTDINGNYVFNNLVPTNYRLITLDDNYVNQAFPNINCGIGLCNVLENTELVHVENNDVTQIDFFLTPSTHYYPNLTGLWYNIDQSGHGLQIEVIKSNDKPMIFATWYAHLNGAPIWLAGIGELNKGVSNVELYITSGTSFPPDFNSENITKLFWGNLSFDFTDLEHTTIEWDTTIDSFENGTLELNRLTKISSHLNETNILNTCQSGSYYNIDQSGHGVLLEVTGDTADTIIITWFTYTNDNKQLWLLATGEINNNTATMPAYYTINSNFPPNFNSSDIDKTPWGEISITRVDKNNISMSWEPNENHFDYGSGSLVLTRLTNIQGLNINCSN